MLSEIEKKIVAHLQGDFPLNPRPYAILAKRVGISEQELIERINDLKLRGVLRSLGAVLNHQIAGYDANVMVVWRVPEEKVEEVGELMSAFRRVSHCYQRKTTKEWSYNMFTMIHGKSRGECIATVDEIASKTGIGDYKLLFTRKELKKTSPKYF